MAEKLAVLNAKEVMRALLRGGFYIHHQTGSHARLLHRGRPELRVAVPIHSKDLPLALLKRILKQASISEVEFLKLVWLFYASRRSIRGSLPHRLTLLLRLPGEANPPGVVNHQLDFFETEAAFGMDGAVSCLPSPPQDGFLP